MGGAPTSTPRDFPGDDRSILSDEEARARRLEALRGISREAAPEPALPPTAPSPIKPRGRRRGLLIVSVALAVALVAGVTGVAATVALRPHPKPAPPAFSIHTYFPRLTHSTIFVTSNSGGYGILYAIAPATGAIKWTFAMGQTFNTPVFAHNVVYTASSDDTLSAVSALSGKQIWSYSRPDSRNAWLALNGTELYVADRGGYLFALDAATGKARWSAAPGSDARIFSSPPAAAGGLVYVSSGAIPPSTRGALYAFDAATGELRWTVQTGFAAYGAPVVANGVVYDASADGVIHALSAASGANVWSAKVSAGFTAGAALANGALYVTGQDGKLYAVKASNGALIWSAVLGGAQGGAINSEPTVMDGAVYVVTTGAVIASYSAISGKLNWSEMTGSPSSSTPLVAGDALIVGDQNGNLTAYNAYDGSRAWRASLADSVDGSAIIASTGS